MATQIQHRRGSTAQHATFTGAIGEITVDTTKKIAVIHDGSTAGGVPLARDDQKNDGSLGYAQEIKTDNYAVVAADGGKMLIANKATAITFTLGAAASLTSKFVAVFKNINAGVLSIAPTGAELIDGANTAVTVPTGASILIKCDGSSFRTYLGNGDVTGNAINTAPALTGANLADNDKLGVYDVSAGSLASVLFSELIAGIFKTARTIANAQFAAATFKLFNAAGTPRALKFDVTALTADRTLTMPDKDFGLGHLPTDIKRYETTITPVAGGTTTVSHGLGGLPNRMDVFFRCTTADSGFAVGDEVRHLNGMPQLRGAQVTANSTQLTVQINSNAAPLTAFSSSGTAVNLTLSSWVVVVRAERWTY